MTSNLEMNIIGVCVSDHGALRKCKARGVTAKMFASAIAGRVYDRMLNMDSRAITPDIALMIDEYSAEPEILNLVLECSKSYATSVQFDNWLVLLLESYARREMAILSAKYQKDITEGKDFAEITEELIQTARKAITFCNRKCKKTNLEKIKDSHEMIELQSKKPEGYFCRYCIPGIDAIWSHGKKQMHVIGAPPGSGKTGFILSCILGQIKEGIKTVLFCNETPSEHIFLRMKAMLAGIPSWKLENYSRLAQNEYGAYVKAMEYLALHKDNYRIFAKAEYKHSPLSIGVELQELSEQGFVADFVAVDYLQNMRMERHNEKLHRTEFIEQNVFEINEVFGRFNVAGVLLSQLNRGREESENEYRMTDLKGSSAIEQEADFITFLKRQGRGYEGIVPVRWYSAKARGGREVNAELRFDTGNGMFLNVSREVLNANG